MILYHGSNMEIAEIDLGKSEVGKDFGVGFYLTPSKEQAERMASRRVRLYGGEPTVAVFEYKEESAIKDGLTLKDFRFYSREWADFILTNRANATRIQAHNYDIVHGPIANDDVGFQIRRLLSGIITMDAFLEELKYKKGITYQYFFSTERSLKYLTRI